MIKIITWRCLNRESIQDQSFTTIDGVQVVDMEVEGQYIEDLPDPVLDEQDEEEKYIYIYIRERCGGYNSYGEEFYVHAARF